MKEIIEKIKLEAVEKQKKMFEHSESLRATHKAHSDSIEALEAVKLDEGTTMHYFAGRLDGVIETCDKILKEISTDNKRKYQTREQIFKALFEKILNLSTDISIVPRDGKLETQKILMFARFRDAVREVEDKEGLFEKNPDYEEL